MRRELIAVFVLVGPPFNLVVASKAGAHGHHRSPGSRLPRLPGARGTRESGRRHGRHRRQGRQGQRRTRGGDPGRVAGAGSRHRWAGREHWTRAVGRRYRRVADAGLRSHVLANVGSTWPPRLPAAVPAGTLATMTMGAAIAAAARFGG